MASEFDLHNWLSGSFRVTKEEVAKGKPKDPIDEGHGTDGTALLGGLSQLEPNTDKLLSETPLLQTGQSGGTASASRHRGERIIPIHPIRGTTRIFP